MTISGSNVTYETTSAPEKINQGGLGWSFTQYGSSTNKVFCNGNSTFRLKPSITMYRYTDADKNNKDTIVNVEYMHDGTPGLTPGISFAIKGAGISLQPSGSLVYNTTSSIALKYSIV
ncbi:MAG: hypothetical protein MR381_04160 [Dorea sp.]|nr:hypothetical protein [Dorea sp.]MDY4018014.1 hypothetical protein [Ruminococcus callidus]